MPHPKTLDAAGGLMLQFLDWIAVRPRNYQETMEAWRTSCPRISVWEDALIDGLVAAEEEPGGSQGAVRIFLTAAGLARLCQGQGSDAGYSGMGSERDASGGSVG